MSALKQEIAALIAQEGAISLERYMGLCLAHPIHGYYMTRDPFGARGDFVTAPEISQMFGELVGVWLTEAWRLSGAPAPARLVELGPGRGTLMADILRIARIAPGFVKAVTPHLVEISPALRDIQRQTLAGAAKTPAWSADLADVPRGPLFLVANEFFDALPVRHYVKTVGGWRERLVGLAPDGEFVFGLDAQPEDGLRVAAREGSIVELCPAAQRVMTDIAGRLVEDGGVALIVDYGYAQTTLGDSLQAVKNHAHVDPLAAPGEADLTAHVDFAALGRAARARGAKVFGPVTQGEFLTRLGIVQRYETLSRYAAPAQRADIAAALERLTGRDDAKKHMGEIFKVLAVAHPDTPELPGFSP